VEDDEVKVILLTAQVIVPPVAVTLTGAMVLDVTIVLAEAVHPLEGSVAVTI
jgi:hypothetical protein